MTSNSSACGQSNSTTDLTEALFEAITSLSSLVLKLERLSSLLISARDSYTNNSAFSTSGTRSRPLTFETALEGAYLRRQRRIFEETEWQALLDSIKLVLGLSESLAKQPRLPQFEASSLPQSLT